MFQPTSGNWNDASSWNLGQVPSGTGVIACIDTGKTATFAGTNRSVDAISGGGTLVINSNTLTLTNTLDPSNIGALTMTGGTLDGPAALAVAGNLNWSLGTMQGSGSTTVAGTTTLNGSNVKTLNTRTLVLNGNTTWQDDGPIQSTSGTLTNNGTMTITGNGLAFERVSSNPTFINNGTLQHSGTGTATMQGVFTNNAAASVAVTAGSRTLQIGNNTGIAGSGGGAWSVGSGATLKFAGTGTTINGAISASGGMVEFSNGSYTLATQMMGSPALTVSGATLDVNTLNPFLGAISVSGGTLNVNQDVDGTSLNMTGGTLAGSKPVAISGNMTWSFGTMSGGGSTAIAGTSTISSSNVKTLNTRTLYLDGNTTWQDDGPIQSTGGNVTNNGVMTITGNALTFQRVGSGPGSVPTFVNNGTLQHSGTGTATMQGIFDNSGGGSVAVTAGSRTLQIGNNIGTAGNVFGSGTWSVGSGATLKFAGTGTTISGAISASGGTVEFSAGSYTLSSTVTGSPALVVSGADLTANTANNFGAISVSAGFLRIPAAISGTSLNMTDGTITGSNTLAISGNMIWSFGTMSGNGSTTVGGTTTLNSSNTKTLNTRSLVLNGNTTWQDGPVASNAGTLTNNGVMTITGNALTFQRATNNPTFTNNGTLQHSGTGTATMQGIFTNSATGSVAVAVGTRTLQIGNNLGSAGGGNGAWSVGSGATLKFAGTGTSIGGAISASGGTVEFSAGPYTLTSSVTGSPALTVSGATLDANTANNFGAISVSGGTLNTNAAISGTTLNMTGGTIAGSAPNTLAISGNMTWSQGTMSGTGSTTIGGTSTFSSTNTKILLRALAMNNGGEWQDGPITVSGGSLTNNAGDFVVNVATNNSTLTGNFVLAGGTLTKKASTTANVTGAFTNSGAVDVQAGALKIGTGVSPVNGSGPWTVTGTLEFGGVFPASTLSGAISGSGTVRNSSGSSLLTLSGPLSGPAVSVTGGSLALTGGGSAGAMSMTGTSTLTVGSALTATSLTMSSATAVLDGAATLTLTSPTLALNWSLGTMQGGGTTLVTGFAQLQSTNTKTLNGRTLVLNGTTDWLNGNLAADTTTSPVALSVNGPMTISSGADLTKIGSGTLSANVGASGSVSISANTSDLAGSWHNDGTLTSTGGILTLPTIDNLNSGVLTSGTYKAVGGVLKIGSGAITSNAAIIEVGGAGSLQTSSSASPLDTFDTNTGTLRVRTTKSQTVSPSVTNTGTITVDASASELKLGPAGTGILTNSGSGVINGVGTVAGNVTSTGAVNPGSSAGTLSVSGGYTENPGSILNIELGGATGGQYDVLAVTGATNVASSLRLTRINGFTPTPGQTFTILTRGSGSGSFASIVETPPQGDIIWVATYNPTNIVLTAKGNPSVTLASSENPSQFGDNVTFTATVDPPAATGSVEFLIGEDEFTGPVALVGGVATYDKSDLPVGETAVLASYVPDGSSNYYAGQSQDLIQTVEPGPLHHFDFGSISSPVAGVQSQFTVTAKDSGGNTITDYAGAPSLSSTMNGTTTGCSGACTPSTSITGFINGVATLSFTPYKAETANITVTQTPIISTTPDFTVNPGAAAGYSFSGGPTGYVNPGESFSLGVTAKDVFANIVTGYVGTVSFATDDPASSGVVLPSPYTFQAGDNGSHTFTGLALQTPRVRFITVDDGTVSSTTFVNVRPPTTTTVSCVPALLPINSSTGSTCTVAVSDTLPNPVTPTGTVALAQATSEGITGVFSNDTCTTPGLVEDETGVATCSVTFTPTATVAGDAFITGTYSGSAAHNSSSGFDAVSTTRHSSSTVVTDCTPANPLPGQTATCRVRVNEITPPGAGPVVPSGPVSFTAATSTMTFSPDAVCVLGENGNPANECTVDVTLAAGAVLPARVRAAYAGSLANTKSTSAAFMLSPQHPTATTVTSCTAEAPIDVSRSCTVTVTDNGPNPTTPTGTVTITGGHVCAPLAAGPGATATCTFTFSPQISLTTLTATYNGSNVHAKSSAKVTVAASKRTTSVSFDTGCSSSTVPNGTQTTCVIIVRDTDVGPKTAPTGSVKVIRSPTGRGTVDPATCPLTAGTGQSTCTVTFTATAPGAVTITASYAGDVKHAAAPTKATTTVTVT